MDDRTRARGLAWFGLGLAETFAPRRVAEAAGLEGHAGLIRLYGLPEIASGVAILVSSEPERQLGVRVAGDLLDGGLPAARSTPADPRRGRTLAVSWRWHPSSCSTPHLAEGPQPAARPRTCLVPRSRVTRGPPTPRLQGLSPSPEAGLSPSSERASSVSTSSTMGGQGAFSASMRRAAPTRAVICAS